MKEVKEPVVQGESVEASISFTASTLKIVAGLVLATLCLSAVTVILNGVNLAKTRDIREQIFRDIIEMQLRFDELKTLMKRNRDHVVDEMLHLHDEISTIKDFGKENEEKTREEIHRVQEKFEERMQEHLKGVKGHQNYVIKELVTEQREKVETFLKKQEARAEYDMKVQTKRILQQFNNMKSHIKINSKEIKTVKQAMKAETKILLERNKENRQLAHSLHTKMTDTVVHYTRATTQEFKLRSNADMIVIHSEFKSLHKSLYSAIQGTEKTLYRAFQREISAGLRTTESVVKYAWKGLGTSIRVQGETNRNLFKSLSNSLKTYSKITETMLTGQNIVLKGYLREQTRDIKLHLKEQDRSATKSFSEVKDAMTKNAQDYKKDLSESIQGQTDALSTTVKDEARKVEKYVKEQKDALFRQNLDLLRILSQEVTAEHTFFDAKIDAQTTEIKTDIAAKKDIIVAHVTTKTDEVLADILAKKNALVTHIDTKTGEIIADILAKKNLVTAHIDTKTGEIIADILAKKNLVTGHIDTKTGVITADILAKKNDVVAHINTKNGEITGHIDTKTTEITDDILAKKNLITGHIDTKTTEITDDILAKKNDVTGHVDTKTTVITDDIAAKKTLITQHMDTKKTELTTHMDEETVKISNKIDATYDNTCPVCPQTKLHFPAANQVTDYVKLTTAVPSLTAVTVCAWVTPLTGTDVKGTLFSYARTGNHNSIIVELPNANNKINVMVESDDDFHEHVISARTHLCVVVTLASNNAKLYINGAVVDTLTGYSANTVPGGGTMIVGQEQDSVGGTFETAQALSGTVENLMVWFSEVSAEDIAAMHSEACFCARNFDASPAINTAEMYGNVAKQKPTEC